MAQLIRSKNFTIDRFAYGVRTTAGILLVVVASGMVLVILGRYIGFATAWADEVARIAFIWSASLGAASGTHRKMHFAIALIAGKGQGLKKQLMESGVVVVMLAMCITMLWATTKSIPVALLVKLPALGVSGAWFHSAVTIFALLSSFFLLNRLLGIWRPPQQA